MSAAFTIGLVQQPAVDSPSENLETSVEAIKQAAGKGAQIICLQELFTTRYLCTVEDEARFDFAEPIPGPSVERIQRVASELSVVIVAPLFERRAPGIYHNSAAVVDADGSLLGVYRKMHIPD